MNEINLDQFYRKIKNKLDEIKYDFPSTELGDFLEFSYRLLDKIFTINWSKKQRFESGYNFQSDYSDIFPEYDELHVFVSEMEKFRNIYLQLSPPYKARKFKGYMVNVMNELIKEYQNNFSPRAQKRVKKAYKNLNLEKEKLLAE